ncbi:hypothetical protein [Paenibacillus sp. YN15]|uniref:hypothetical protein n=1 Tax=Paenibacillus sp. YN15 TaxID=1742774 RepID=UPI000DCCF278|nr:hypothetical protein [Paenibacillus sp. YN15]RAU96805.1 hypothetical protein DQG13_19815 [Paenibacillus sp. YN15]
MAKLTGVSVVAEKITYNGAEYVKTDESAKAGDIIRIASDVSFLTDGGYYVVDSVDCAGDPQITDDEGDSYDICGDEFEVFAKVSVAAPGATSAGTATYLEVKRRANVGERIRIVSGVSYSDYGNGDEFVVERVDLDGDVYITDNVGEEECVFLREYVVLEPIPQPNATTADTLPDTLPEPYVIHDGKVYVKETRKAAAGERILIVNPQIALSYGKGDVLTVKESLEGGISADNEARSGVLHREYVVLTPVTSVILGGKEYAIEQRNAKAGDIVLVTETAADYWAFSTGMIGTCDGESGRVAKDAHLTFANGKKYYVGPSASKSDYVVLVPQEDTQPVAKQPEAVRLTVGDYAKVTATSNHNYAIGDVVKITEDDPDGRPYRGEVVATGRVGNWLRESEVVRATPEEVAEAQRKKAEADAKAAKLKLKVGDKVRINVPEGTRTSYGRAGVTNSEIGEVTTIISDDLVRVRWPSFSNDWNGKPAELDVVTPEEAAWAKLGRKVGEFKAGDIAEFAEPAGYNALTKGDIGVVGEPNQLGWVRLNTASVVCGNWCTPKELRLIAPVESLFNSAINSASTAN